MNGEDKEYYYETKAVVLQYLGLVPGALSNTAYTQLDHSTSSSIRAINQSSRSVSEEELSSLRSSLDTNDLEQLGFSEGLPVLPCQGDGINRNDGRKSDNIAVGPPQDSGVQGHCPRLHFSTSVSVESFASNNTSLVSKHNWLSNDDLLSDTARERHCAPSREELTQGVQSDGLTHLMAFSPRRHALSDPPDSSMLLHQRPLADRSNLQLQLTSTPPSSEQSMYTPRHRSNRSNDVDRSTYLQYLQNEYDEVRRHSETPTSNNVSDSPEAEVARMLEAISREVMRTHGKCVTQATNQVLKENLVQLTYEDFREAADGLVQTAPPGIHRISLALCFSRQLASALLLRGSQSMRDVTEYSVQFVANTAANFIVDRGGWFNALSALLRGAV